MLARLLPVLLAFIPHWTVSFQVRRGVAPGTNRECWWWWIHPGADGPRSHHPVAFQLQQTCRLQALHLRIPGTLQTSAVRDGAGGSENLTGCRCPVGC